MCEMFCQIVQKKREEKRIEEEQAAKAQNSKIPACCDDDDYNFAITPNEPVDSLNMRDEHLNTISATESDEFIKSYVKNLVPNPSESEGENGCDFPACLTTFSNILFDAEYEFDSSDDQPHHFDAESDLIESMLNRDSSIISSSSKINSLLDEFAGELTLLKSIPSRIDETGCDPENEFRLTKRLLYDNSSPHPSKEFVFENSNVDIESFFPSPIPNEDSDSHMEGIDLTFTPDDPMPPGIEEDDDDSERDIIILKELFDTPCYHLPPHLEYTFLEGDNKLPVIIAKELGDEEKFALIKVLKSHKRAIAWKLSDILGINLEFCTHKILMEEDYKPAVQHQRRVNLKINDIIKNEIEKLLDARLIYPISDSLWVSPVHCVPKKGGFTVVENEENELILTRLVTGWRGTNTIVSLMVSPDKMLQRCEDTNLCLNWEKSHFMVKGGTVLGHKISKNGIEVDKAKVDVIAKLPHPTTVKGVVLGQRHEKHFRPIHYASKTMTDAKSNYTTTKKEMLAVLSTFSKLATMDPRGDIMVLTSPPRRSLMPVSFGPPSTRMPTSLSKTVTRANNKEKFHNVMRCLRTPSKFVKFLTFGALTLWSRSRLHEGTNIFSWPSFICRNGLKRKRSPPMTPELFASSLNLSSPDLVPLELS
nr:retrovirus-related Pol polyprotein [Tanacetum cinerariifolium]